MQKNMTYFLFYCFRRCFDLQKLYDLRYKIPSEVIFFFFLGLIFHFFVACQSGSQEEKNTQTSPSGRKVLIPKYAKLFRIDYFEDYKILTLRKPMLDSKDSSQFVLLKRGKPIPSNFSPDQVIEIPIQTLTVLSTTHIALADMLGEMQSVTGVADAEYVTTPSALEGIAAGKIKNISTGNSINHELVVSLKPDMVMASGLSSMAGLRNYQTLIDAKIKVVFNSEWMEETPLGRAEWIKFMAAFYDKESQADSIFEEIEEKYLEISQIAKQIQPRPTVLLNMPYKSVWYVPGGNSYVAKLLSDAGFEYFWKTDTSTVSLPLAFEAVVPVALQAEYWLMPGTAESAKELLDKDSRFGEFQAFRKGLVFNNNRRVNEQGGNDYWASASLNPHLVLADMVKIIRPDLLPKHEFVYFKKLE